MRMNCGWERKGGMNQISSVWHRTSVSHHQETSSCRDRGDTNSSSYILPPPNRRERKGEELGRTYYFFIPSRLVLVAGGRLGRGFLKGVFKQFRTMRLSGNISAWRWSVVGVLG